MRLKAVVAVVGVSIVFSIAEVVAVAVGGIVVTAVGIVVLRVALSTITFKSIN